MPSLSAIKYAKVKVVRDEAGLATGFEIEGDFPKYGNDDDRADEIGVWLLKTFLEMIKKRHTYRNSEATTSILTITSNAVSYTHLCRTRFQLRCTVQQLVHGIIQRRDAVGQIVEAVEVKDLILRQESRLKMLHF